MSLRMNIVLHEDPDLTACRGQSGSFLFAGKVTFSRFRGDLAVYITGYLLLNLILA